MAGLVVHCWAYTSWPEHAPLVRAGACSTFQSQLRPGQGPANMVHNFENADIVGSVSCARCQRPADAVVANRDNGMHLQGNTSTNVSARTRQHSLGGLVDENDMPRRMARQMGKLQQALGQEADIAAHIP